MYLVQRIRVDQCSCRYIWASSPAAAPRASSPSAAQKTSSPAAVPQAPSDERARPSGGDTALEALTDDLIAAYQATLSKARGLSADQRAQVVHVVAESARHGSQRARNYRSEGVADRLDRFQRDLPDLLGKALGIAHDQALKWIRGQSLALAGGGAGVLAAKFSAVVGVLVGGAVGFLAAWASLGAALFKSGSAATL